MSDRFRPTRAGVINIWDYVDEEWAFADGRLALRGHNGSGKTKALEVLFPFVLDGVADSRRLDPFSGENRTMKSNLLYRGQESEYGYVWMEFARSAQAAGSETVTLIIGMRAHRSTDGVRMSFYVTSRRLGVDFGLLSADSRPLTERQLRAVLEPDAWRKTATEYRDLVDSRLFGLGRERYAQLVDLLLALRRPLLAKDLDPVKVSDTLTAGLSPVDEYLVQQAARDFENLAAVQKLFDDLTAADAAVRDFLTDYTAYLRAHVRFQLDRAQARADAAAGHAEQVSRLAAAYRRAIKAERQAEADRDARRNEGALLQGKLTGLKSSEEYKAQGRIEDKRREVLTGARELVGQRSRLGRDRDELGKAEDRARTLTRRAAAARNEADRYARDLTDAAERSGIADDGFGPVDSGDDLLQVARARVAARRDDVGEIRRLLQEIRDANGRRRLREQDLADKQTAEQGQEQACSTAAERLARASQAAADTLAAWASRWSGPAAPSGAIAPLAVGVVAAPDVEALTEALGRVGETGATSITEVFDGRTAERQAAVITVRAYLETDLREIRERLAGLRAKRDAVAVEQDDAPPAGDLRPASREGRPGAPLWRLVRFADGIDHAEAAAVEGALYGAGMLTAWIHPDPALTQAALAGAEADGYLVPSAPVTGRTLADILVPEDQDHVSPAVINAVLGSVALTDDIAAATVPAVSANAQFTYGVHVGARPKAAPEYIGATNRASRRRARLTEYDELIKVAIAEEARLVDDLDRAGEQLEDFRRARQELPDTRSVAKAAEAVGTNAALLARARHDTATARQAVDAAIAQVDAGTRQLRQAAAERRMPTADEQVDAIARAAAEFEHAATKLDAERSRLAQAEEDLAAQTETIERRKLDYTQAADALAERERFQQALEEEFRTLEENLQADVQQVLGQIRQTERLLAVAEKAYRELDAQARAEHDTATGAEAELRGQRQSLADAVGQLYEHLGQFGEYARPDLRALAGVTAAEPWPDPARWPDAALVGENLGASLVGDSEPPPDPAEAVRGVLPQGVAGILDAFAAASRGGREVTEGTLRNTADRMSGALKVFTEALAACDEDYRVDWDPGAVVTVHVIDDEGRKPVAQFATRITERVADQGVLLEERERKVLEDELLAELAKQIHGRVIAARDLTRDMNSDTKSKPMSSGLAVGIRWAQSDKITDLQRATSRLLERDSRGTDRLAELRSLLREMIREYRASHPRATYREALSSVLDYRSWHAFELLLIQPGEPEARLTRAKHSVMSGGEKSAAIHLPLFAAANALYSSAKDHCPRMIALDEAFVGIDERYKPDLFGLAVKFDLDLFMTGHDLWVTAATVPMIAHYDMLHDKTTRTVSSMLMLWDGEQVVDASAGYADNDDLVAQLLGFRPTRHAPLGTASTLYGEPDAEPEDDEDDAESV